MGFLPATKSYHYLIEEAVAAGIEDIIITGKGKRAIDQFDRVFELAQNFLEKVH